MFIVLTSIHDSYHTYTHKARWGNSAENMKYAKHRAKTKWIDEYSQYNNIQNRNVTRLKGKRISNQIANKIVII